MTSFYSWRLFFLTFEGRARWQNAHGHGPISASVPIAIMAVVKGM
jgi:NADH:ubiquinone oxidoreductase subunit 5 (subunit L)/multisubunit Na+/H+ antiporter MnhA subunit